jgi:hypothetical protein
VQSLFATETGGLFQTGNSVASAERTSAARYRVIPGSRGPLWGYKESPKFTNSDHLDK